MQHSRNAMQLKSLLHQEDIEAVVLDEQNVRLLSVTSRFRPGV
jgi:hypothetical protein